MAYRDFDLDAPDADLQRFDDIGVYSRSGRLPWRRSSNCPNDELRVCESDTQRAFPLRRATLLTRPAFSHVLASRFESELADAAANALARSSPNASARRLMSATQARVFAAVVLAAAAFFAIAPVAALIAFNVLLTLYFLAAIVFRLALTSIGFAGRDIARNGAHLTDAELPVITVLVPLYREAQGLEPLAAALAALDYPREKLDIKLLLEADDAETMKEAERLGIHERIDVVVVPPVAPRTKPKACNYGLYLARGDLVVIYDAEDEPEYDQLRKAAAVFAGGDDRLACVQARLNYYDFNENWLTKLFAVEYALWFDTFLPALEKSRLPIPLGGTSNFFRTKTLIEIGGWDPHNVTEDADLGLRLARRGYRTEILDSTTFEEANCDVGNWIRQRSRWMKGHMQTWLVHMREPSSFIRVVGWRGFLAMQLFIGGNFLSALINPFLWIVFLFWLATRSEAIGEFFPGPLLALNLFALLFGNCLFIYLGVIAPLKRGWVQLAPHALLAPAYWWLMSIAAYKGLWQLLTRPSFWEKTDHLMTRAARQRQAAARVSASL